MLRIPRLLALLNVERFKQGINDYYNKRLKIAVKNQVEGDSYPILRALMFVQAYKIIRLVIIIFTISYFLGVFLYIGVCDIEETDYD
jgi:hypothetical protein